MRPLAVKLEGPSVVKKTSSAKTPVAKNISHTSSVESEVIRVARGFNEQLSHVVR